MGLAAAAAHNVVEWGGGGQKTYAAVLAIWPRRPGPWETGAAAAGGAAAGA